MFHLLNDSYRWIKHWDIELGMENRHIALTLDNFSGHDISYQPKFITLIHFQPGLTPFVQPLDAGIIRCFKAHYRREYCLRAIERDDAEEEDIYKIDLLEAMLMAKDAWKEISSMTIKNCWDHTRIQRAPLPPVILRRNTSSMTPIPTALSLGWDIVVQFASEQWTLPEVHERLAERLGDKYVPGDWNKPLDAVLGAEDNLDEALSALECLRGELDVDLPDKSDKYAMTEQRIDLENELQGLIDELKKRRRITGEPLGIDEFLDPKEEQKVGETSYEFEGGCYDMALLSITNDYGCARLLSSKGKSNDLSLQVLNWY